MRRHPLSSWSKNRLRMVLAVFFMALAVPTAALVAYAYSQLKWEAFHRERGLAEELVKRIDRRFKEVIAAENARPFTDYTYFNVAGTAKSNLVQRSPLSSYPVHSKLTATLGHFQIDHNGRFSTPLLPGAFQAAVAGKKNSDIDTPELQQRIALRDSMLAVLSKNKLINNKLIDNNVIKKDLPTVGSNYSNKDAGGSSGDTKPSTDLFSSSAGKKVTINEQLAPQAAFEQLQNRNTKLDSSPKRVEKSLGRLEELNLSQRFEQKSKLKKRTKKKIVPKNSKRLRKEQNILPQRSDNLDDSNKVEVGAVAINMFESEIDALDFSVLDSGHFVLFRKVWKNGQRLIQGVLYGPNAFIDGIIRPAFYDAGVSRSSDLTVAYEGNILSVLGGKTKRTSWSRTAEIQGFLLLNGRLSEPFSGMDLVFSANQVPAGPGGTVVNWLTVILLLVLCSGFLLMYRLGSRQITLAQQQQDFISAVSHELKTPLTSIRMYGEMLMQGWATEDKRKQYYEYIFDESERLTRLINNVLQMARMTRNELQLELQPYTANQLVDTIGSKVSSQIERAGFVLKLSCQNDSEAVVTEVDLDYFIQIVINLVDNAVKFSAKSEIKQIDISCQQSQNNLLWRVRDYGPGIPKNQMRKIFGLFYRSESELTRETLGTGIGLALVTELTEAMQGSIDVEDSSPGVEFQISFPVSVLE